MSEQLNSIQNETTIDLSAVLNYEEMMKAGVHFGRKRTVFNPKMNDYVFTMRNGICIIDLIKTKSEIERVANVIKEAIGNGKLILFVGITKQSAESIKDLAEHLNMPFVINRWIGGTLTNFKIISGRVKNLEEIEKKFQSGEMEKYTKKERLMFERKLKKMKENFEGLTKLTRIPDFIFVSSLKESLLPVNEAKIAGPKIIAISNTDSNPNEADYFIPANDRSKKSVDLIIGSIKEALK